MLSYCAGNLLSILVEELDDNLGGLDEAVPNLLWKAVNCLHLSRPEQPPTLAPDHVPVLETLSTRHPHSPHIPSPTSSGYLGQRNTVGGVTQNAMVAISEPAAKPNRLEPGSIHRAADPQVSGSYQRKYE